MLLHNQGCHLFQSLHFTKVVQDAQKKIIHQCLEDLNSSRLHPSRRHGNMPERSSKFNNRIYFTNTDMGRQLHPSGRQANTVQTQSFLWYLRAAEVQPFER